MQSVSIFGRGMKLTQICSYFLKKLHVLYITHDDETGCSDALCAESSYKVYVVVELSRGKYTYIKQLLSVNNRYSLSGLMVSRTRMSH